MITLSVPGSKSITNRALLMAALARGTTVLKNALESDDTKRMRKALAALGVRIKKRLKSFVVFGSLFKKTSKKIRCGNAGTVMRFLTAVLATQPFESILDGEQRMRERPIADLADALTQLGACVTTRNGYPPVRVRGPLKGGHCTIKSSTSSQFLSGLLMAAPLAERDTIITVREKLTSEPYVAMTLRMMKEFGVEVKRTGPRIFLIKAGQRYKKRTFEIEGDATSASYFRGIGALTGEKITIQNVPKKSLQGDTAVFSLIRKMGANGIPLSPLGTVDCRDIPDAAMTLIVLAAFAQGVSAFHGLANLRVKETNRIRALIHELKKIGCRTKELRDGIRVYGKPEKLHGARIHTYNDHRIAMCFGMASVALPGLTIENPSCVNKTYPGFWRDLARIKKTLRERNVIITGMRGTGKSTLGEHLAQELKRRFIDTDTLIEKHARIPIREIVARYGWGYFRKIEKRVVRSLRRIKNAVIATGGGTLMDTANALILKSNGKVIVLDAKSRILRKRLSAEANRPSLTGDTHFLEEIEKIYASRKKTYTRVADAVMDVSAQSADTRRDVARKVKAARHIIARFGLV